MAELSPTRYTKSNELSIAYRVAGDRPTDIIYAPGWVSNVEYAGEGSFGRFLSQLADFSRAIVFDKRESGLATDFVASSQVRDVQNAVMFLDVQTS